MLARAVFHSPVRLMSMVCFQLSALMSCTGPPRLAMPALATTMSSRPSSPTPASTAAASPPESRTSAWVAMIRRSWASTSLTVSARSSGVAIGSAPSTSLRMSMAMMSAPSEASLTAWLRPWPRPAPVMKATLPSTLPGMDYSLLLSVTTPA
jgi:hypothetical protein